MTTIYPHPGSDGPWAADDTAVQLDGYFTNFGILAGGAPTVDGAERSRPSHHGVGGMVHGHDEHLVHIGPKTHKDTR